MNTLALPALVSMTRPFPLSGQEAVSGPRSVWQPVGFTIVIIGILLLAAISRALSQLCGALAQMIRTAAAFAATLVGVVALCVMLVVMIVNGMIDAGA